jgi:hypothetical protein
LDNFSRNIAVAIVAGASSKLSKIHKIERLTIWQKQGRRQNGEMLPLHDGDMMAKAQLVGASQVVMAGQQRDLKLSILLWL